MAKKRTSCSNIGEDSKRTVTSIILLLRPSGLSLSHQPVKSRHECIYTSFVIKGRSRRARELVRLCNRVSCGKLDGSVKPSERARRKKGRRGEGRDGGREKGRKEGRKEGRAIALNRWEREAKREEYFSSLPIVSSPERSFARFDGNYALLRSFVFSS